jgi:hypothetical protein
MLKKWVQRLGGGGQKTSFKPFYYQFSAQK